VIERVPAGDGLIVVGSDAGEVADAVRAEDATFGRVAGLIGAPDDPAVQAALDEMRRELFDGS
jgi:hypothetical protein